MIVSGMILARFVTDTALRLVREHALEVEAARQHAEMQANELAEANELLGHQLDQQQELLQLVTSLETPVVSLANGILLAPLVGHIDVRRAQAITERLLMTVSEQRTLLIVLDISGVAIMDTTIARSLLQTIQALRLLGCEVVLSGISASTAMTLIHLGINLEEVRTVRSPQEALVQFTRPATQSNLPKRPDSFLQQHSRDRPAN
jgi:anti-anti-sigma factor